MDSKLVLVVGDKFEAFTVGKGALTISVLRERLAAENPVAESAVSLVPGQGLATSDIAEIRQLAERSARDHGIDWSFWQLSAQPADAKLCHKVQAQNSLVSEPRRVAPDTFELDLLVDDDCEIMADHQTGQHLQGMLLVEAARQAFLAVTEHYFVTARDIRYYFVINEMAVRFERFLFPVPATIRYRVLSHDVSNPHRLAFSATMEIEQVGTTAAQVDVAFTAFDESRLLKKESALAAAAFHSHMEEFHAKSA